MASKRFLTIYFIDGSKMAVKFPKQGGNPLRLASRVKEAVEANQIAIEADGEFIIVPMSNVKYMKMSPVPDELPETVIRGGAFKYEN